MHRYFFATKDTTINSGSNLIDGTTFRDKNVGQDEVLEIKKVFSDRTFKSHTRSLVQPPLHPLWPFVANDSYSANHQGT